MAVADTEVRQPALAGQARADRGRLQREARLAQLLVVLAGDRQQFLELRIDAGDRVGSNPADRSGDRKIEERTQTLLLHGAQLDQQYAVVLELRALRLRPEQLGQRRLRVGGGSGVTLEERHDLTGDRDRVVDVGELMNGVHHFHEHIADGPLVGDGFAVGQGVAELRSITQLRREWDRLPDAERPLLGPDPRFDRGGVPAEQDLRIGKCALDGTDLDGGQHTLACRLNARIAREGDSKRFVQRRILPEVGELRLRRDLGGLGRGPRGDIAGIGLDRSAAGGQQREQESNLVSHEPHRTE